jgi:hypothetical protein
MPGMYIERLQVRNLRLLAEQEFSFLGPDGQPRMWTVIVGENGVCKSTILQAIALAALGPKLGTAVAQDAQQFLNVFARDSARIKASFRPQDQGSPLVVSLHIVPERHDLIHGTQESLRMDEIRGFRMPGWFVAGYGVGRFLAKAGEVAVPQDPIVDRVEGLFDLRHKLLGLDFISVVPDVERFLRRLGRVLFAEDGHGDKLLPGLTGFEFRKAGSNPDFMVRMGQNLLPVRWLSDGYKAMLAWIADLLGHAFLDGQREVSPSELQGVVLLDEIDLHLHPTWQRRVVPILKRAFPKLQFIVTTHSPLVLAGFEKEEIIQLRFQDGLVVQDPSGIEPGVLTASELLTNFFEVPRAGRPDLVQKERRYLELKALGKRETVQDEELKALESELQPYWSSRPEPETKPRSPKELVTSQRP